MAIFHVLFVNENESEEVLLSDLPVNFFGMVEDDLNKLILSDKVQDECSEWFQHIIKEIKEKPEAIAQKEIHALLEQFDAWFQTHTFEQVCTYRLTEKKKMIHTLSFSDHEWDHAAQFYLVLRKQTITCTFITDSKREGTPRSFSCTIDYGQSRHLRILYKIFNFILINRNHDDYFERLEREEIYEAIIPYLVTFIWKAPVFCTRTRCIQPRMN